MSRRKRSNRLLNLDQLEAFDLVVRDESGVLGADLISPELLESGALLLPPFIIFTLLEPERIVPVGVVGVGVDDDDSDAFFFSDRCCCCCCCCCCC